MSGCGPGSRATGSAALFVALEAYPPVGTTPGVPGGGVDGGLPDVHKIASINPHTVSCFEPLARNCRICVGWLSGMCTGSGLPPLSAGSFLFRWGPYWMALSEHGEFCIKRSGLELRAGVYFCAPASSEDNAVIRPAAGWVGQRHSQPAPTAKHQQSSLSPSTAVYIPFDAFYTYFSTSYIPSTSSTSRVSSGYGDWTAGMVSGRRGGF
jgi:hypothetical protein